MTATSRPRRASAGGRKPATSARPPVLAKPTTSEAASSTRIGVPRVTIRLPRLDRVRRLWRGAFPGYQPWPYSSGRPRPPQPPADGRRRVGIAARQARGAHPDDVRQHRRLLRPAQPPAEPERGPLLALA